MKITPTSLASLLRPTSPPGLPAGFIKHKKGGAFQIYRKVWIDRDKYTPLKGVRLNGHEEAAAEDRVEAEAQAGAEAEPEARPAGDGPG